MTFGSIRVASMRPDQRENWPEPGETAIRVDRANKVLGNPHVLHNQHDARARADVIDRYIRDAQADRARRGPISQMMTAHARRVVAGERLVYFCWCSPRPCHGDWLAQEVLAEARLLASQLACENASAAC
jgi:hypothetical protein